VSSKQQPLFKPSHSTYGTIFEFDLSTHSTTMSEEGIYRRRMIFCPALLNNFDTNELWIICDGCERFLCVCCTDYNSPTTCHHYSLVFTDGACSRNGYGDAVSGIGGAFGEKSEWQWSIPVDDYVDPSGIRTNQRAELLAAIEGVRRLGDFLRSSGKLFAHEKISMVVATDSEYVCKGVTEWMPRWKVCYVIPSHSRQMHFSNVCQGKWLEEQSRENRVEQRPLSHP